MIELEQSGWAPGVPLGPFKLGDPLVYRPSTKLSTSYFAALVHCHSIFGKAVPDIDHYQHDNYYKCLMLLDQNKLALVLAGLAGQNDDWFRKQLPALADQKDPEDGCPGGGGDGGGNDVDMPLEDAELPLAICPDVEDRFMGWSRKRCNTGPGTPELRIFFDLGSHPSGLQQSWLTCLLHPSEGCIRWRRAQGEQKRFCSYMYAWHEDGALPCNNNRTKHMAHEPGQERVDEIESRIVMEDF